MWEWKWKPEKEIWFTVLENCMSLKIWSGYADLPLLGWEDHAIYGKNNKENLEHDPSFPSILQNLCTYVQEMFVLFSGFLAGCFSVFPTLNAHSSPMRKASLSPFTDEKRV